MSEKTKKALEELKRVRDELRVKIDLAGKEAKGWWDGVEPHLNEVEHKIAAGGEKVADMSKAVADEMASAFRRIRDRMSGEEAPKDDSAAGDADSATDAEIVDDD